MTVFGFHSSPLARTTKNSTANPKACKMNGPVLWFGVILTRFWWSYSPGHVKISLNLLSAVKNCMFGGDKPIVFKHPRWNQALFPTKHGWGCWLWWFPTTWGHLFEHRLLTSQLIKLDFSMGLPFWSHTFLKMDLHQLTACARASVCPNVWPMSRRHARN